MTSYFKMNSIQRNLERSLEIMEGPLSDYIYYHALKEQMDHITYSAFYLRTALKQFKQMNEDLNEQMDRLEDKFKENNEILKKLTIQNEQQRRSDLNTGQPQP